MHTCTVAVVVSLWSFGALSAELLGNLPLNDSSDYT